MTALEFLNKWSAEAETLKRRAALVDGATLLAEVLADFAAVTRGGVDETLNLQEAARECGYSADHLGRLLRDGKLPNAGRPNAPRIRRRDLPHKASALRPDPASLKLLGATPGQIARAVVTSTQGDRR
jgi:hypothetical protein